MNYLPWSDFVNKFVAIVFELWRDLSLICSYKNIQRNSQKSNKFGNKNFTRTHKSQVKLKFVPKKLKHRNCLLKNAENERKFLSVITFLRSLLCPFVLFVLWWCIKRSKIYSSINGKKSCVQKLIICFFSSILSFLHQPNLINENLKTIPTHRQAHLEIEMKEMKRNEMKLRSVLNKFENRAS